MTGALILLIALIIVGLIIWLFGPIIKLALLALMGITLGKFIFSRLKK